MSPVALGLDLLLAALLLSALVIGVRLNGRLKALRDSQAHFVQAVSDLDQAAARAESGLAALKIATEDTHDQLLVRIETARGLIAKLERASLDAERMLSAAPPPSSPPVARSLAAIAALAEGRGAEGRLTEGRGTEGRGAEGRGGESRSRAASAAGRRTEVPPPASARPRGRPTFDEDLFDSESPLDLGPLRGRRKDDRR